jgi:KDO2-lipid IV(A) lauroyltransferase
VKSWLVYIVYNSMWRIVRWLPESLAYGLFGLFAKYSYRRNGKRVQRLRQNYSAARPSLEPELLEQLVREGLANAMRYWCDTFRISDWSEERVFTTVRTVREELLIDGIASGRGLVVALPHSGNWDHAGLYFCSKGITVHTVAEQLKPERLFRKFLAHREAMGIRVLDIKANVTEELLEVLRNGGLVALVSDRDLSKSGIDVNFLGGKARMPAGPALLAYRTGADLITAYVSYRESGIEITFNGPFSIDQNQDERSEILRVTQLLADQFGRDIRNNPTSWQMLQRVFIELPNEASK